MTPLNIYCRVIQKMYNIIIPYLKNRRFTPNYIHRFAVDADPRGSEFHFVVNVIK